MRAFIVRPFGTRKGINFDQVEKELIGPALERVGATGRTTGEIMEAGNIRIDMFQQLLAVDLVVADISTNNPNVFYELGIRHSLQEKRTFLIRAKTRTPQAMAAEANASRDKEEEVPFDLKTDRYFEYDPGCPKESLEKLTEALRDTLASESKDSPIFLLLPNLKPQAREPFITVPLTFGEEAEKAERDKHAERLILLGLEAQGSSWESAGLRVTGRALFRMEQYQASRPAWESLQKLDEFDFEANKNLGNIFERLEDLAASDLALTRALKSANSPSEIAEIHGQMGRNKKDRWIKSWSAGKSEDRARLAIGSSLLVEAYQQYFTAYRQDLDSYYPGLNALALTAVILELAAKFPDDWNGQFGDEAEASQTLIEIKRKSDQIKSALQLVFDSALAADAAKIDKKDEWLLSSAGDFYLLALPAANKAVAFYRKASDSGGPFVLGAARKQLNMLSELGVMKEKAEQALASLPPAPADRASLEIDRVILFTGHRVDAAGREKARFPQSKEPVARDAIRRAIQAQKNLTTGSLLGISGGANGGDILFLETCEELGVPTEMLLALPESQFVNASVASDDLSWEERFNALLRKHPNPPVLAESSELPKWLQFKRGYDIWQRNNLWLLSQALSKVARNLTLIALWDGETGDGPGGTEHMVSLAKQRDARVVHLNTKELFGLETRP